MSAAPESREALERLLEAMEFEPRPSLEAEIVARVRRGEPARPSRALRLRWILGVSAAALVLATGGIFAWQAGFGPARQRTIDRCCQDLDGGGGLDDGLLVVTGRGDAVDRLAIYEDRDGSRSLTAGDSIRFMRNGALALTAPLGMGARTAEFCCLDYDGGGPSDDALLVVGRPPDQISLAAIYEFYRPAGSPARLR